MINIVLKTHLFVIYSNSCLQLWSQRSLFFLKKRDNYVVVTRSIHLKNNQSQKVNLLGCRMINQIVVTGCRTFEL